MMTSIRTGNRRAATYLLGLTTLLILTSAVIGWGSHTSTTSWSAASRLGTVQALVDQGVEWIDASSFAASSHDRIYIGGHYYAHHPALQSYLMAGVYQLFQKTFGLSASSDPESYCYWMNFTSAGLAFILAVLGMYQLALTCGLSISVATGMAFSLGFGTIALQYGRSVNSHIILLAIAVWGIEALEKLAFTIQSTGKQSTTPLVCRLGLLGGFAFSLDQVIGATFLLAIGIVLIRLPLKRSDWVAFILFSTPFVLASGFLNWNLSGSVLPLGSKVEYFIYPGSPWTKEALTGHYYRRSIWGHLNYGWILVFSDRGIILNNFPLWLSLPAIFLSEKKSPLPILCAWVAVSVLIYTLLSGTVAGLCLSVRWFIPLIAVGYYVIVKALLKHPEIIFDFSLLTAFGVVISVGHEWELGPWLPVPRDILFSYMRIALISWAGLRFYLWLRGRSPSLSLSESHF